MTEDTAQKRFAVIDGKSVFYRGYYAMPNLATKDGTPTGGVFGFATMALEVIRRLKPDYVAVAWDKPKTNIRRRLELYSAYKAGRKPAPPDFYEQIPVLHELLDAFGWPLYELDDYEADDIMGTLAVQAREHGLETLLVTSDLDMLQMVNGSVKVYALKTGLSHIELYSPATFEAKYGLRVDQFLDFKALKGDSSDNIPGVPGIGEKTAIELLKQYGTLDGIYDNVSLIKEPIRKKLEGGKKLAYLSKEIGRIWTDAPLKLDLSEVNGSKIQPAKIRELFEKLEFRSLLKQLPDVMQAALDAHDAVSTQRSGTNESLFTVDAGENVLIDNTKTLAHFILPESPRFFIFAKATGRLKLVPDVLFLSTDGETTYVFDLLKLEPDVVASKLAGIKDKQLIGYDVKTALKVLLGLGVQELPTVAHDILVGAFLLNSLRREQTLTELADADIGYRGAPFDGLEHDELLNRASELMIITRTLYEQQSKDLATVPKLPELAENIEWPVIPVLARMEFEGIKLDVHYLERVNGEIEGMIKEIEQQIYEDAGGQFNIGSPAQLADVLFSQLRLSLPTAGIKRGKTGYSTAASELDKLRGQHPIIDHITQWREVTKLKNTYIDTLPQQVDDRSRIHTTFNLTVAQTGRLSSTDPNLQNIPVRTELGRQIRTAFVADPGNKFVSADYSQFELRLSAALSHDQDLIDLFNRDIDIHVATAAQVYGRKLEDVTKQMRRTAKVVNFGILYGMSPHGLSAATGMTFEQSRNFIREYMSIRKPLVEYLNNLKEQARKEGYVETLFGRRRPMPDIQSSNFAVRSAAERAAINMPIQGTEADLMKLAMVQVDKRMHDLDCGCKQLLQIHDSILVECPSAEAVRVSRILKETMENVYLELPVKLTVETSIGDNWGQL